MKHKGTYKLGDALYKVWDFDYFCEHQWKGKWENKPKEFFAQLVRYLFEKKLKIPQEEIPKRVNIQLFYKNKLSTLLLQCFNGSTYAAIQAAYPNQFKPWEFANKPKGIWSGEKGYENAKEATKWLIEEKLKIPVEEIPQKIKPRFFKKYDLDYMLHTLFERKWYKAVIHTYPQFSIKDFKIKRRYRNIEKLKLDKIDIEETNEIIKKFEPAIGYAARKNTYTGIDVDDNAQMIRIYLWHAIQKYGINKKNFIKYKYFLIRTIALAAKGSRQKLSDRILSSAQRFKVDLEQEGEGPLEDIISQETVTAGKHQNIDFISPSEKRKRFHKILARYLTKDERTSLKNNIDTRIRELEIAATRRFNYNWNLLEEATRFLREFVQKYKDLQPWDLKYEDRWEGGMGLDMAKRAIRYLFEERLKIPVEDIPKKVDIYLFHKHGLGGMLIQLFKGHPYEAIAAAYPNKFKPWEFKGVGAQIWKDRKNRGVYIVEATRWFIEKELKINPKEALKKVYLEKILGTKMPSMLYQCFGSINNDTLMKAVLMAYPELFPKKEIMEIKNFVKRKLREKGIRRKDWQIINRINLNNLLNPEDECVRLIYECAAKKGISKNI